MQKKFAVLAVIVVLISIVAYLYFGIISPVVPKPQLQKPQLTEAASSEQINWVVNELGGYKLHPSITGEQAEIEVVSGDNTFSVTTADGKTVTTAGKAANPDIRITASYDALVKIFGAADVKSEIVRLYNDGSIDVELIKDEAALALKGYKGVYDELQGK